MKNLDLSNINDLFSSKYRLAIMALLSGGDEIEFAWFRSELQISDGNLSSHMDKLEKAGYISIKKQFVGKKPRTSYRITAGGLDQYQSYLNEIAKLF
ncbi:MAG: transcriptional regulator [Spirochaetales bacterium]|nr:transcriptional regulator [Spirochaetales bacterium]